MKTYNIAAISGDGIGTDAATSRRTQRRARLMGAIERVTSSRIFTPDLGGRATTTKVTEALCKAIEASPARV
jgi:isocitrate/isopropylmalate dehydrogenase